MDEQPVQLVEEARQGAFYEVFKPARAIVSRIEFDYTPKHGSWLNIAENELSCLTRQCGFVVLLGVLFLWNRGQSSDAAIEEALFSSPTDESDTHPAGLNNVAAVSSAADSTARDSAVKLADLCTTLHDVLREADRRLPPAGQPTPSIDQQRQILLIAGIDDVRTGGQTLGRHLKQTGSPDKFPNDAVSLRDQANQQLSQIDSALQQLRGRLDPGLLSVVQLWHTELKKQSGILWRRHAQ